MRCQAGSNSGNVLNGKSDKLQFVVVPERLDKLKLSEVQIKTPGSDSTGETLRRCGREVDVKHISCRSEHFCYESDKFVRVASKRWRHRRLLAPSSLC